MQRTDLLDTDGENKAIRSFLRFCLKPGVTIGEMRGNMESAGWEGCWPDSIGAADWNSTLTKFELQAWLRYLFGLEAQFAPDVGGLEVRAGALPDYARDQAGAGATCDAVDARWEREHQALINNPAIKVVGRMATSRPLSPLLLEHALDAAAAAVEASAEVWTGFSRNDARTCIRAALEATGILPAPTALNPIPMQMNCPECGEPHVDEGPWATRLHKTHQCQACKHEWRPYEYPTVGVAAQAAPAGTDIASRIVASGGEILKLVGCVAARAGASVETEGIEQQVAYINRVLTELSPTTAADQGTAAAPALGGVIMPRNMSEDALLLMGSAVRAALCKLTGSDGYVVKHVFGVLRAHLAEHDHGGPALGTAEHVLLPAELDDDLWRAGIEAFRKALNQRTGLDLFVAQQTYQGLYDHLAARRANLK